MTESSKENLAKPVSITHVGTDTVHTSTDTGLRVTFRAKQGTNGVDIRLGQKTVALLIVLLGLSNNSEIIRLLGLAG